MNFVPKEKSKIAIKRLLEKRRKESEERSAVWRANYVPLKDRK